MSNATAAVSEVALAYFRRRQGHFWQWVEEGNVIEWLKGDTISYRAELARVLHGLAAPGLPPLSPVLLLLAACADTWPGDSGGLTVLHELLVAAPPATDDPSQAQLKHQLHQILGFMAIVRALPVALRSEAAKLQLFREVFSAQAAQFTAEVSQAVLAEWDSGRLDAQLFYIGDYWTRRQFLQETDCLAQAANRFPTTEALALLLRTGLDQLPAPLPDLPAPPPAAAPTGLLAQLAQDPRTAGLAQLTQHLVAALRIPMHTQGASDRPLGGVADLTNRGNFDQLLLSELAHDDLSLLARLANNEALYLRREEPPRPQARPRVILLDTTLRLWGTPRVFALAAALAWAQHAQLPRSRAAVSAYALGGQSVTPLDLTSFEGIVSALGLLDPALHCGAALRMFGQSQVATEATDYLLITEAQLLRQPEFGQQLAAAQPALRFVLTVERAGTLELHEYVNGHRNLLQTSQYTIDELLAARPTGPGRQVRGPQPLAGSPAYLRQVPAPLFFPTTGLRVSPKTTFFQVETGLLGITETRRVLHWPSKATGALELLPVIEEGEYCFGSTPPGLLSVLVSRPGLLRVYVFDTKARTADLADLTHELKDPEKTNWPVFRDGCYYIWQANNTLAFDCRLRAITDRKSSGHTTISQAPRFDSRTLKSFINNGYNTMHRLSYVGINGAGELVLDTFEVRLTSQHNPPIQQLRLLPRPEAAAALPPHALATYADVLPDATTNPNLLRCFTWPNGSTAITDRRGLLHLRSADANLPEITLLLVIGQPTAAWAANGTVCGPDYFTGHSPARRIPAEEFLRQYLQRFTAGVG